MKNKYKILHIIRGLEIGGAETLLLDLIKCGNRAEFEFKVWYCLDIPPTLGPEFEKLGVVVEAHLIRKRNLFKTAIDLVKELREEQADLVHLHLFPEEEFFFSVLSKLAGAKIVVTVHDEFWKRTDRIKKRFLQNRFFRFITSRFKDNEVHISHGMLTSQERFDGQKHGTVKVVHNGINLKSFDAVLESGQTAHCWLHMQDRFKICIVANLIKIKKGYEYLLPAISLVVKEIPEVVLVSVGRDVDGFLHTLKAQAADLGIEHHVIFLGKRRDAAKIINGCDLFVLPSKIEGFGIVLLEAMALKKPVVASNTGGIPEIVSNGKTGLLVEPGNPISIANAIADLYRDRKKAMVFGENGRRTVEESFTIQKTVGAYEDIYLNLLGREPIRKSI